MKKILSIFFNIDRTYLTGLSIDESGVTLDYINSTIHHIDFEDSKSEESQIAISELKKLLFEMDFKHDEICVSLPSDIVFVTKFPINNTTSDINQMLGLEIRQMYPQFDSQDFTTFVVPFWPDNPKLHQIMAVIVHDEYLKVIDEIVKGSSKTIVNFYISQINVQTCFLNNYPEMIDKTVILLSIQGKFMEIIILESGRPVYYNIIAISDYNHICDIFEKEYKKIVPHYVLGVESCYFIGTGLTKNLSMMLCDTAGLLGISEAKRLNAFRMIKSNISKREEEYCSRTFHIFPACVGAALPLHDKTIYV